MIEVTIERCKKVHEDKEFLAAWGTGECRAALVVVLSINHQSYLSNEFSFFHFLFIHRYHVENFGTLLDMLTSNGSVHSDKRLGTSEDGVELETGRFTPYGVTKCLRKCLWDILGDGAESINR